MIDRASTFVNMKSMLSWGDHPYPRVNHHTVASISHANQPSDILIIIAHDAHRMFFHEMWGWGFSRKNRMEKVQFDEETRIQCIMVRSNASLRG